jgi:peptidoglycan/xylan/chitin deacetylase (PgdA/CDA1 family)
MLKSGYNIAVTFDDAYQRVLKNALPVLRKNIPATIVGPTGSLGSRPLKNSQDIYIIRRPLHNRFKKEF